MSSPVKIGIFGGSFDPPHVGHFICARDVAEKIGLSEVYVIPAAVQPHKPEGSRAPAEIRWEMVCAAVADDDLFKPSRIELDRGSTSYTIDTVTEMNQMFPRPGYELYCIVGADSLAEIETWKNPEAIFRLARVAALARNGYVTDKIPLHWRENTEFIDTPNIEISSTWIRDRVKAQLPVRTLVGHAVDEIIKRNNLYRR